MMFLFHIFLFIFLMMITDWILRNLFHRFAKKNSFQQRCLHFLLMALYFLIFLNYEGKNGYPVEIPASWEPRDLLLGTLFSFSGLFILLLIVWFDYSIQMQNTRNKTVSNIEADLVSSFSGFPLWIGIIVLGVLSGVVEELVFRYYIIDRISRMTPHLDWAVSLSSFLYGLIHFSRNGWMAVCFRGIIGFLLAVLLILTQNLLFVITIHIIWTIILLSMRTNQLNKWLQKFKTKSSL